MKNKQIITIIAIILFVLYFAIKGNNNETTKDNYLDCGNSEECYDDAVKSCTPAIATIDQSKDNQILFYEETVEGTSDDYCIITFTYTKSSIPELLNKSMICHVPNDELNNYKEYLQGDIMNEICSGSLVDMAK